VRTRHEKHRAQEEARIAHDLRRRGDALHSRDEAIGLALDRGRLSPAGLVCIQRYFLRVNAAAGKLRLSESNINDDTFVVMRFFELQHIDLLWALALETNESARVINASAALLIKVHENVDDNDDDDNNDGGGGGGGGGSGGSGGGGGGSTLHAAIRQQYLDECMRCFRECAAAGDVRRMDRYVVDCSFDFFLVLFCVAFLVMRVCLFVCVVVLALLLVPINTNTHACALAHAGMCLSSR
jgi:hypothetical protein